MTIQLYDNIQVYKQKVSEPPKNIEKLTEIKEFMN